MEDEVHNINYLAITARPIPYHKAYRAVAGSVTAAILWQQLEYWFDRMQYRPFFKFLESVEDGKFGYKKGDSWTEELGFSAIEFRNAFKKIGVAYTSKAAFDAVEEKFKGKMYCSYYNKVSRQTWYFRNGAAVKANLQRLGNPISRDEETSSLETRKPHLDIQETTQEITQKTTKEKKDKRNTADAVLLFEKAENEPTLPKKPSALFALTPLAPPAGVTRPEMVAAILAEKGGFDKLLKAHGWFTIMMHLGLLFAKSRKIQLEYQDVFRAADALHAIPAPKGGGRPTITYLVAVLTSQAQSLRARRFEADHETRKISSLKTALPESVVSALSGFRMQK